jgi:hypothetical protein
VGARFFPSVGFFQPVAGVGFRYAETSLPKHVELLHSAFKLKGDIHKSVGMDVVLPRQFFPLCVTACLQSVLSHQWLPTLWPPGVPYQEATALLAAGKDDELIDRILDSYEAYRGHHDLVVVEVLQADHAPLVLHSCPAPIRLCGAMFRSRRIAPCSYYTYGARFLAPCSTRKQWVQVQTTPTQWLNRA